MMKRSHITVNLCILGLLSDFDYLTDTYCPNLLKPALLHIAEPLLDSVATPVMAVCSILLYFMATPLPDIDQKLPIEHRGWTHTIYPIIGLYLLSSVFAPLSWAAFGYFCHLLMDSPSAMGDCWFNPYGYRKYGQAKVKKNHFLKLYHTNKPSEYIFVGLIIGFTIWYLVHHYIIGA